MIFIEGDYFIMITNPLSYTSNCHESLASVLKKALKKMGVQEHHFDSSSSIAITLDNNIVLNIGIIHDRLWLWSSLNITDDFLYREPARIFSVLTAPVHRVETGQFVLGKKMSVMNSRR
ncbi:hypothetical protein P4S72_06485 [Vibrio sp. PP-XX7]